jgi:hypothetical protein
MTNENVQSKAAPAKIDEYPLDFGAVKLHASNPQNWHPAWVYNGNRPTSDIAWTETEDGAKVTQYTMTVTPSTVIDGRTVFGQELTIRIPLTPAQLDEVAGAAFGIVKLTNPRLRATMDFSRHVTRTTIVADAYTVAQSL